MMLPERKQILVVDDEPNLRRVLSAQLARDGYDVHTADDGEQALALLAENHIDLVITDLRMPKMDGMELLRRAVALDGELPVVMITAHGTVDNAVEALKTGAFDYITKPFDQSEVRTIVKKALRTRDLSSTEVTASSEAHPPAGARYGIIGQSAGIQELYAVLERVADTPTTVLVSGESGTGKELVARALHENSSRRDKPFIKVNCAAIPRDLMESELFGYERGAFTGATRQTPGKIETAHRGTLFLDEIGDLPLALQPKLLRFLQERAIERLGGRDSIAVDVRVVCATHRDPKAQIAAGELREDLYYRLAEIVLSIPPLRSRIGDPGLLAHFFLRKFSASSKRGSMSLSAGAIEAIEAHPWAGNVRELESAIKRAVIMAERNQLQASDLGLQDADGAAPVLNLQAIRERAEREAVARALGRANGNITKAAELLGVSRPTLYDLMARAGLRSAGPPADE